MLYPLVSFFLYTYLHMCISNINLPNLGIKTMNLVKSKDMDYKECCSGFALLDKLLLNEKSTFRVWFFCGENLPDRLIVARSKAEFLF